MSDDLIKAKFDNHENRISSLEKNTKILETMDYKIGLMEKNIDSINKKLDNKQDEKSKKWDKLIDYIFYAVLGILLGYIAYKLGLK